MDVYMSHILICLRIYFKFGNGEGLGSLLVKYNLSFIYLFIYLFPLSSKLQENVKSFLCLTKYHATKTYPLFNLAPRHEDVLGEWRYNSWPRH
jgi:hypothetical protein